MQRPEQPAAEASRCEEMLDCGDRGCRQLACLTVCCCCCLCPPARRPLRAAAALTAEKAALDIKKVRAGCLGCSSARALHAVRRPLYMLLLWLAAAAAIANRWSRCTTVC